ncbi:MAG: hypothetical protein ACYDH3_00160 [Candidatus Aminicenantales bacterium]
MERKSMHFTPKPDGMTFPENEPETVEAVIIPPETQTTALAIPDRARALVVKDQAGLDVAKDFMLSIDVLAGQIEATFDPQIALAHKMHKSLLAEKAKFMTPLTAAKYTIGRKAADFVAEQEEERKKAERERLDAEEKARQVADKAVDKAEKLEAEGKGGAAAAVVNGAHEKVQEIIGAAPVVPEALDTSGLTVRENWKFSIVNKNLIPREYLMPDEKMIGMIVRAKKDQANIPGVRVYAEKGVATRAPRSNEFEGRI